MADLRDMQLLAALSRHRHFARAAEECGISQPAFSARIRNMEAEYAVPLVKRGNRFMGFTREGDIVLKWALRLLADADGLDQEISEVKGALSGRLAIGAVPTALAFAARAPAALRKAHPDVTVEIVSESSVDIQRGLEDFSLDAGITYLDGQVSAQFSQMPLYEERYVLLAPYGIAPRLSGTITWREAAELPLCLLTRNMHNREIIDAVFRKVGVSPAPAMETNAFTAALVQVVSGHAATIAPEMLANGLPLASQVARLTLTDPVERRPIGLVTAERAPVPPALRALRGVLSQLASEVALEARV